jgi:O-antigen/teichoic acid export membrane protein
LNIGIPDSVRKLSQPIFALVFRRLSLSLIDQAIVSATRFLANVAIGRVSKPELGLYYLAMSVFAYTYTLQEQIISTPYIFLRRKLSDERQSVYVASTVIHVLLLNLAVILCVLLSVMYFLFRGGELGLATIMATLALMLASMSLREHMRQIDFAHLRWASVITLDLSVAFLQIGGLFLLWKFEWMNSYRALFVVGVGCLIADAMWWLRTPTKFNFEKSAWIHDWRANWDFSKWIVAGQLVASAGPLVLPWLITFTAATPELGKENVGTWAASFTLIGLANMFIAGVCNYLTPRAAEAIQSGPRELRRVLKNVALFFLATLSCFALGIALFGDTILTFLYGSDYQGSGTIMTLLACSMIGLGLAAVAGNGLYAVSATRDNFVADACTAATTILGGIAFIPFLGPVGAALAQLLGQWVSAGSRGWLARIRIHDLERLTSE